MTEKRFIEQFEENVRLYPDKVILRDEHHSLTFRELDELSGRVYAYLKEKGIGREDFVMISLPRGVDIVAAMIGVWKAGAAFVIASDSLPLERKRFISHDCSCIIEIDNLVWADILGKEILHGKEDVAIHDAAFAVYTSGSEGKPKGILHEAGQLDLFIKGWRHSTTNLLLSNDIAGMPLPFDGTLAIVSVANALYIGAIYEILPLYLFANPSLLEQHLIEHQITFTGLPASYLNSHPIRSPYLRIIVLSMGLVENIKEHPYLLANVYGQSEGPSICMYYFKSSCQKVPVGRPTPAMSRVAILDDNDHPVESGKAGELCYENPFTRGYINLPEETARAFRNGLYHTGDIARINEDGNYVILGRKSDMIKINGNRIEPAEIEAAVKRVLGIDWAFAKGFVEKDHSYIVVYYTADINLPSPHGEGTGVRLSHIREQLLNILPTYMIPSYFVHLDEIPHLPNGKVDRQALKAPEIEQYRAEYVAPVNDIEKQLCAEMERILGTSIGALDDFYLMGGDSLRTIQLVTNLSQQPSTLNSQLSTITVTDIYAARTPRAIAARLQSRATISPSSAAPLPLSEATWGKGTAKLGDRGLLPYSQMVYDLEQQMPGVYTFPFTLEYDPEQIDTQRLNRAIGEAIAAHPVFEGNERYYSIEAIEARGEKTRGYLKMRLNRILGDGYSFGILLEDICRAYHGLPIPKDHYIDYLAEYKNHTQTSEYAEHHDALVAHYADCGTAACPVRPTLDKEIEEGDEWLAGEYSLPLSEATWGKGATQWRDRGFTLNERVCLATAMAIMDYCGTDAAALTWAYLGRENEQQMHIFGSLHKDIPLCIERPLPLPLSIDERGDVMKKMLEQVREEMRQGIIMSDYPYTLTQPYHATWAYAVNVLQQPRLEDINLHGLELNPVEDSLALSETIWGKGATVWRDRGSYSLLDIEIEDHLLRIKYSATHYRESSIARFAELIQRYL